MISVIIPVYNAERHIDRLLNALRSQDFPSHNYEVIIVNDGSTDNTLGELKKWSERFTNLKIISISHSGPGIARNKGAEVAKGGILLFIDADCIPSRDWLKNVLKEFEKEPDISILYGSVKSNVKGSLLPFFITFNIRAEPISPANMAIKKEVFINLKGFDPAFSYFAEDWEFWFRVKRSNLSIKYCEDITVYHPPRVQDIKGIQRLKNALREWTVHLELKRKYREFNLWRLLRKSLFKAGFVLGVIIISLILFNPLYLKIMVPLVIFWSYGSYRVLQVKSTLRRNNLNLKLNLNMVIEHILTSWLNPLIILGAVGLAFYSVYKRRTKEAR